MVKLRLKRMGSKFNAFYRIVAADARAPRDGRFIEELGYYNPHTKETFVNKELRTKWEKEGAVASTTVKNLFKKYDKVASQGSKEGVVTLEIKPKKVKKQETKVDEIIAEKSSDVTEEISESKANELEESVKDTSQAEVTNDSKTDVLEDKKETEETVIETKSDENNSEEESSEKALVEEKSDETNSNEEEISEENKTDVDEANSEKEVAEEEK